MPQPEFEFKLNVVSVGNFILLAGLLWAISSGWADMRASQEVSREQRQELVKEMRAAAAERKVLFERDGELTVRINSLQAQLVSELANVRTELRVLNGTVAKLETALERLSPSPRRP